MFIGTLIRIWLQWSSVLLWNSFSDMFMFDSR